MTVKAPFRFARVNRFIVEPEWAPLASHDVPFSDGVSGTATITLRAITPFVIGGERTKNQNGSGTVRPLQLDGEYVIPPSTMQGHVRSILEIAGFGRIGDVVEKRRYGGRDMSPTKTGELQYLGRLNEKLPGGVNKPRAKAGWLTLEKGEWKITPCEMARIHVNDAWEVRKAALRTKGISGFGKEGNFLHTGSTASERYEAFLKGLPDGRKHLVTRLDLEGEQGHLHAKKRVIIRGREKVYKNRKPVEIRYRRAWFRSGSNVVDATLVFTGKPKFKRGLDPLDPGLKKWEFAFYDSSPKGAPFVIDSEETKQAFLYLHDPNHDNPRRSGKKDKDINPNWKYWKKEFYAGGPVPVFYWLDENGAFDMLAMSFLPKAAYAKNTHDLLANSDPGHLVATEDAPLDLPALVFGTAAEGNNGKGLKRRAWFGIGRQTTKNKESCVGTTTLLEPKPSYLGIYVRQKPDGTAVDSNDEPFASYSPLDTDVELPRRLKGAHLYEPEIAGIKIWPAAHEEPEKIWVKVPHGLENSHNVHTKLFALPPETVFEIPLTFHNLRPQEFGALLWALSYGEEAAFDGNVNNVNRHHRLGMGKPYGLGEVALAIDVKLDEEADFDYIGAFRKYMEAALAKRSDELGLKKNVTWAGSVQIKALEKASDPTDNDPDKLEYMDLNGPRSEDGDSYVSAKGRRNVDGHFLVDYVDGEEFPRPSPQTPQAAPPSPRADPDAPRDAGPPVKGARVRFKPNTAKDIRNQEGVIVKPGQGEFGQHLIRFDNGRKKSFRASLFVVISPPPGA